MSLGILKNETMMMMTRLTSSLSLCLSLPRVAITILNHFRSFFTSLSLSLSVSHLTQELGGAGSTKRPTSCVLILQDSVKKKKDGKGDDDEEDEKYKKEFQKARSKLKAMQTI